MTQNDTPVHPSLPQAEMDAIKPHSAWDDGRTGFLWCRFDAMLDEARRLRAEVTWADNGEDDDADDGQPTLYHDPRLWIETNRPHSPTDPSLATWDGREIVLTNEEAVALVTGDPLAILETYKDVIAQIAVWSPADGY